MVMSKQIIPQDDQEVKCSAESCSVIVFRDGLCFEHFVTEEIAEQGAQEVAAEIALNDGWWGYPLEEVLA